MLWRLIRFHFAEDFGEISMFGRNTTGDRFDDNRRGREDAEDLVNLHGGRLGGRVERASVEVKPEAGGPAEREEEFNGSANPVDMRCKSRP